MKPKTQLNEEYIREQYRIGREAVLLGELPHPEAVNRTPSVLAVEGNRVYLRSDISGGLT